ncbi:hypothetical protein AB5I41_00930 [Sphingomonas sp. MMS24-JH45]
MTAITASPPARSARRCCSATWAARWRRRSAAMEASHVRFAVTLTDAQYARILDLVRGWDQKTGNATSNLGKRNCVHFVREAALIAGLTADFPRLMKKPEASCSRSRPRSWPRPAAPQAKGRDWLATLPPLDGVAPIAVPEGTPGTMPAGSAKKAEEISPPAPAPSRR